MTGPVHAQTPLVCVAWIASIPGLTADGAGPQLPADNATWAQNGYIVVPVTVGGTPHTVMPLRRPVVQLECWTCNPGSGKPDWPKAEDLAEQVRAATYDRRTFNRPLTVTLNGVPYPGARVLSARMLTEPHRIYGDQADYAGVLFSLALQWIQPGEVVP